MLAQDLIEKNLFQSTFVTSHDVLLNAQYIQLKVQQGNFVFLAYLASRVSAQAPSRSKPDFVNIKHIKSTFFDSIGLH